ncbi:B3/4 domain-containing protein [Brevibacillus centrosporus]|uniref:B3/B4 domain-containing protein n=1 Tax=Brevibacillus centrosporus TaxID=54910 RepID=UPI002E1A703D|nr:phenylalanine--tRNA ligase beta subunit-related protein [Brevibacillus centrosporus]MED1950226.1 phenylalanine--tRNA ligase beta subunit-related protein [Brevibacillus centrosporus]
MKVQLDATVFERLPRLSLGILHYSGASVSDSPKMLQGRINYFVEGLRLEHDVSKLTEIEGIREWRAAFKQAGIDPSRYRPSSEALLRRLLQGNAFFWINSAVDINNFFSVHHALPFGIYDQDQLMGDVVFRIGRADDIYEGLNGREVNMEGKLLLADENGAFGSPIVDSKRTSVTESSRNLMQVIFFHEQVSAQKKDEILGSVGRMFTEINGGEVTSSYLLHS